MVLLMRLRAVLVVAPALALATACTTLIGLEDLPPAPPTPDAATSEPPAAEAGADVATPGGDLGAAVASFASAFCDRFKECSRVIFETGYRDVEECRASQIAQFNYASSLPGHGGTAAIYAECARSMAALPCDQLGSSDGQFACNVRGSRKVDEKCVLGSQCETGFCGSDPTTCRVCATPPANGAPCAANSACGPGLVCNRKNTCVTQSVVNQSCSDDEKPCRPGLACVNAVCTALPAVAGAACTSSPGCDVGKGLFCSNSRCVSVVAVGPGGSCAQTPDAPKLCLRLAPCSDGTCAAPPTEGQPCGAGGLCLTPLLCLDGKCAPPTPASACP